MTFLNDWEFIYFFRAYIFSFTNAVFNYIFIQLWHFRLSYQSPQTHLNDNHQVLIGLTCGNSASYNLLPPNVEIYSPMFNTSDAVDNMPTKNVVNERISKFKNKGKDLAVSHLWFLKVTI